MAMKMEKGGLPSGSPGRGVSPLPPNVGRLPEGGGDPSAEEPAHTHCHLGLPRPEREERPRLCGRFEARASFSQGPQDVKIDREQQ